MFNISNQEPNGLYTETAPQAELELDYLTVPTALDKEWLQKFQQTWDSSQDPKELFQLSQTQTRTITRFTREGLEGRVTGYTEITVPSNSATAKNSISINRKPAHRSNLVRGASGYYPFIPGGLEEIEATAEVENNFSENEEKGLYVGTSNLEKLYSLGTDDGLLEIAPGFERGLNINGGPNDAATEDHDYLEDVDSSNAAYANEKHYPDDKNNEASATHNRDSTEEDIDVLLPIEFPALAPHKVLKDSSSRLTKKDWAHMVDVNYGIQNFHELVPQMARQWPFELDNFQKEAVYHLENGDSIFVAAHTSAGKTVIAEYAIALAAKRMTKAIYTSPIKALSNQKFRDFQQVFNDVGIITGDVQIKPEGSCLIMTTEILRSMLYRGADIIRDIEFVIFDEVHYVNDLERGVVWEEVIIMLPEYITLILLSATVPNTYEFASWVGRTKKKNIYVISTSKRPVPLEHYLWANRSMHKIVGSDKKFLEKGYKDANDALSGKDKQKSIPNSRQASSNNNTSQSKLQAQRGGRNQRGTIHQTRGHGNISQTGRGGTRTTASQDRNIWIHLIQFLKKENMLPACLFVFSKRRCEENADALSNLDYCSASEKSAIHIAIEKSIARLKPEDRELPQIRRLRELLKRGIAVHHGGMLPIMKEVVEILFAKSLVKVLFATETFAMGLNLPTRTVVFSGYRKHDGRSFRDLLPGEYTQMAGRAGRRGLDSVGYVIIVVPGADAAPPISDLRRMILGEPTKLRSQFRLTYNMILNLLRVEALRIEEMIKRSFSENSTQALLPEQEKSIQRSESDLNKINRESCSFCDKDLSTCHQNITDWKQLTSAIHLEMSKSPAGQKIFTQGRLIIFYMNGVRTVGVITRDGFVPGKVKTIQVVALFETRKQQPQDLLPYLPIFLPSIRFRLSRANCTAKLAYIPISDVEFSSKLIIKSTLKNPEYQENYIGGEISRLMLNTSESLWEEFDWSKIRNLGARELLYARKEASDGIGNASCIKCPDFLKHFASFHDEWLLTEKIAQLRGLISDRNLQLLPDYEQRVAVLRELHFVNDESRIELKGKVACEIHSADELVLTELILENTLAAFEPSEIAALLSAFVFQEKTDVKPTLTPALEAGIGKIIIISEKVNRIQTNHQVILASEESNDFVSKPRFGMVEVVYEWAKGMSFNRITDLTDAMEGTVVRVITRLDETCREVKNAARIIGDLTLYSKMQICQELIKRDVCSVASLYM